MARVNWKFFSCCCQRATRRQGRCWSSEADVDDALRVRTCWLDDHVACSHLCLSIICKRKIFCCCSTPIYFARQTNNQKRSSSFNAIIIDVLAAIPHRRPSGWLCTSTVTRGWLWWALKLWSPSTALVAKVTHTQHKWNRNGNTINFVFISFSLTLSLLFVFFSNQKRLNVKQGFQQKKIENEMKSDGFDDVPTPPPLSAVGVAAPATMWRCQHHTSCPEMDGG